MNDQEKAEYKVATYLVGFFFFLSVWWIWNALDMSVFAVSAAAPEASSTKFSLGVLGTDILAPLAVTIAFVLSKAGKLILQFGALLVARFTRDSVQDVAVSGSADASKISAQFRKMDTRMKSLETTVGKWETVE